MHISFYIPTKTGIGLDDIFILLSGVTDSDPKQTIETRMRHVMRTSGVAITITSITDFIAFAIGASSVFLSVRNFCLYTGKLFKYIYIINMNLYFFPTWLAQIYKRHVLLIKCTIACRYTLSYTDAQNDLHNFCF